MTAIFTGRPTVFEAITARITCGRGVPLEPNPPPTCGEITRTAAASRPNACANVFCTLVTPWFESYIVIRPSSQIASVACGSIGLLCSAGV